MNDTSATATTEVQHLYRVLTAVTPFAEQQPGVFDSVRIEAGGGVLTATATNRYVVAHARGPATGNLLAANLHTYHAKALVDALGAFVDPGTPAFAPHADVTLTVGDGRFEVTVGRLSARVDVHGYANWPADVIVGAYESAPTQDTSALQGAVLLDLDILAKIRDIRTSSSPARFSFGKPDGPVRVEIEDWFTAVVMPMKATHGEGPTIRYGLPAEVTA